MKLYQIYVSRAECDAANRGEMSEKMKASRDAMCFGTFAGREFYTHVADIATDDLEEAFTIGNIGPESRITRHDRMHSVSVGDVLVNDAGDAFIVKNVGFAKLDNWSDTMSNECIWEDCDQGAIYCAGHALEFANVSSEKEAILLRHKVVELEGKVESLLRFVNAVATGSTDVLAAVAAELVLAEHGRRVVKHQNIGLGT